MSNVVNINDKNYIIEPFLGEKGLKLKIEVAKVLAPAFDALKKQGVETMSNEGVIVAAIQEVVETTPSDKLFSVIKEIITGAKTEQGKIDFNIEFSKNYSTLYQLIYEVLKENYSDVFSKLGMNVG